MPAWLAFVDLIRSLLLSLAHTAGGSVGSAIFALSVVVRLIMLPWAVRLALRGRESAERLRAIQPELKRLQEKHQKDPQKLWAETRALHAQHGIRMLPKGSFLNMLVQAPLGMAVYRVIAENSVRAGRFLWMTDLARPDLMITGVAAVVASLAVWLAPSGPGVNNKVNAVITGVITVVITWRLVAGVGLYWVGSSAVGVAQSLILQRVVKRRR